MYRSTASKMRKRSLPISGHRRVARPSICSYKMRLYAYRNTRLAILGTSTPVVSGSTVTAMFG